MNPAEDPFPEILLQFVESFDDQVRGHARTPLTEEQRLALDQLAGGEASQDKRNQLIPLLSDNDEAIEYLASKLK